MQKGTEKMAENSRSRQQRSWSPWGKKKCRGGHPESKGENGMGPRGGEEKLGVFGGRKGTRDCAPRSESRTERLGKKGFFWGESLCSRGGDYQS